jgi:hypothetical protein
MIQHYANDMATNYLKRKKKKKKILIVNEFILTFPALPILRVFSIT